MAEDASVVMHDPRTSEIGKFLFVMSLAMLAS
jgi:MFS family permease